MRKLLFTLAITAWTLGGCASDMVSERVAYDPPDLEARLAKEIPNHWQWERDAFCARLDWLGYGDNGSVDAAGFGHYPNESTPGAVAEALTKLGLLERLPKFGGGYLYRRTPEGAGLRDRWCIGKRTFVRIKSIEPPWRSPLFGWERDVLYEYQVSGMPAFSQTETFRSVFPNVPREGEILTGRFGLNLVWQPDWTYSPAAFVE